MAAVGCAEVQVGAHFDVVESLAAFFGGESAGFEQMDRDAFLGEARGQEQSGYSATEDADRGLKGFACGGFLEVDVQGCLGEVRDRCNLTSRGVGWSEKEARWADFEAQFGTFGRDVWGLGEGAWGGVDRSYGMALGP